MRQLLFTVIILATGCSSNGKSFNDPLNRGLASAPGGVRPYLGSPMNLIDLQIDFGTPKFSEIEASDDSEKNLLSLKVSLEASDLVLEAQVGCGENHLKIFYYDGPMLGTDNASLYFVVKNYNSDTSGCRMLQAVKTRIPIADFWTSVQRGLAPSQLLLNPKNPTVFQFWNIQGYVGRAIIAVPK